MKSEKIINYKNDMQKLLQIHGKAISKKLAYLLALMITQTPEVILVMLEKAINEEFGFMYSNTKKTYPDEFKATMRSVLINGLTKGYDKEQALMHVYGHALKTVGYDEIQVLRMHYVTHMWKVSLPAKEKIPNLMKLLKNLDKFQDKFKDLPYFIRQSPEEIAIYSILFSTRYGQLVSNNTILLPMIAGTLILFLMELGITLSHFLSSDNKDNAKVIPIILTSIMINVVAVITLFKTSAYLDIDFNRRKMSAVDKAETGLTGILPELILIKETVDKKHVYSYELPIFQQRQPVIPAPLPKTESGDINITEPQRKKVKSRPAYPNGLFKTTPQRETPPNNTLNDEIIRDGITYHRRYNQSGPTNDFVGYDDTDLEKLTSVKNINTFKKLLNEPKSVPPRGHQGIVRMPSADSATSFKLKSKGDERLLFSQVGEEEHNGQTIRLYRPSQSKTHNQMGRMKQS